MRSGNQVYRMENSMKITQQEVLHVASLARLEIDPASVDKFASQIGQVLEYVDTLNQVDTRGVAPTTHAISLTNAFRDDIVKSSIDRDAAMSNAPGQEDGNFQVPKVIG